MDAPTQRELIDLVYAKVEAKGPYDFVRKLDLGPDGYQKWHRWTNPSEKTGEYGNLHYEDAIKMLDALGWIRMERPAIEVVEEFVRRLDAGERVTAREQERVAKLVDRLERDVHILAVRIREGAQAARKG